MNTRALNRTLLSVAQTASRINKRNLAPPGAKLRKRFMGSNPAPFLDKSGRVQLVGSEYSSKAKSLGWKTITREEAATRVIEEGKRILRLSKI